MHIDRAGRQYTTVDGQRRAYPCHLLRRSFRDEQGRPRKETLANLSALPLETIDALRKVLKGATLVDAEAAFETERSVPHGDVAAAHVMATRLGLKKLLGSASRERDIAYALILSQVVRPKSKLSTARWWSTGDTTLGADLGVADASTDEVYAAMDWLVGRQQGIEATLAARHCQLVVSRCVVCPRPGWRGGGANLLPGHSRDGERGRPQIEYGLLTCQAGRPVAIEVFAGNTSDALSFTTAVARVRDDFGIEQIILVGDRGMITTTRITELRECAGTDWITALRAPAIAALASDDGPLQPSLFDTCNLAEITHPNYPGERLICGANPVLAEERARQRQALLAATEKDLAKIATSVHEGRLTGAEEIGERIGKVIGKHKVGKHLLREVTDTTFTYRRNEDKINTEAALDGIYVIRTSVPEQTLNSTDVVTAYKNLKHVERDFPIITADDLDLRPIHHYLDKRVRAHVLICTLAAYLTWHLREALTELTFTDQHIPDRDNPVAPAQHSPQATATDATKHTPDGLPLHRYKDLLHHLSTLDRQVINFGGQRIEKITTPTPVQRRAFELLGASIPVTLQ
jgi:hypothetical protein